MPKPPAKKSKKPVAELPVKFPEVTAEVVTITPQVARDIIGWTPETEADKFGDDYLLKDEDGNKIRCVNNTGNRPLYRANVESLCQEQLNQRWKVNGEPIIRDKQGMVHNGQHCLVALILGEQRFNSDKHWKSVWKGEPFQITKVVVSGIDGDDATVNTIDTAKPRSLTDVLFRSGFLPKGLKTAHRKQFAGVLNFAIKFAWGRTGAGADAYAPRRTHSEAIDFYASHKDLMNCVKHVWDEEGDDKKLSRYLPLGTMSGLMYLMAASGTTEVEKYRKNRHQKNIDMEFFAKAEEFITLLAGNAPDLKEVRNAIAFFDDKGGSSQAERLAVLIKSWLAFAGGDKLVSKQLIPKYTVDADSGERTISETITCHGIDMGDEPPPEPTEVDTEDDVQGEVDEIHEEDQTDQSEEELEAGGDDTEDPETQEYLPTPEEIEEAKKKIRKKKGE